LALQRFATSGPVRNQIWLTPSSLTEHIRCASASLMPNCAGEGGIGFCICASLEPVRLPRGSLEPGNHTPPIWAGLALVQRGLMDWPFGSEIATRPRSLGHPSRFLFAAARRLPAQAIPMRRFESAFGLRATCRRASDAMPTQNKAIKRANPPSNLQHICGKSVGSPLTRTDN
jgi:hypothetical protein